MKRSPLRRKTPLKSYAQLKQKTPLKSSPFKKSQITSKTVSSGGNRGLKGHGRTQQDIEFHNLVAGLGCIACKKLGVISIFPVRIHHVEGRNKGKSIDHSERKVLPLCDQHHNPSLAFSIGGIKPDLEAPSVHVRKRLFVDMFGSEMSLVLEVYETLNITPPWILEQ